MKKVLLRSLSALLLLLLLIPTLCVLAEGEDEEKLTKAELINQNFDSLAESSEMKAPPSIGNSYGAGKAQVTSEGAIKRKSIRLSNCSFYWWNWYFQEKQFCFEVDLKLDGNYKDTSFYINAGQNTSSANVICVTCNGSGEAYLGSENSPKLLKLEIGEVYSVKAVVGCGSNKASLYANGELISDSAELSCELYVMRSMGMSASGNADSYIIVDNLKFYAMGRTYAQRLSYQEPGEIPEIVLPDAKDYGTQFWFNKTELTPAVKPEKAEDGTFYVPLKATLEAIGYTVEETEKKGVVSLKTEDFTVKPSENGIIKDGKLITLTVPFGASEDGTVTAPPQFFTEVLDCKIWYDEFHDMLVYSNGNYKNDGILRVLGSRFYMNGEPYYEISFNKFDLVYQISGDGRFNNGNFPSADYPDENSTVAAAEDALSQLHEAGFKSIRCFGSVINMGRKQEELDNYFAIYDLAFDLCDKYDIKVVICFQLIAAELFDSKYTSSGEWVSTGKESAFDLMTDRNSTAQKNLREFLHAFVNRYKDRGTILMWEAANEGNLTADLGPHMGVITYSILQLGNFYAAAAEYVHEVDPDRPFTGGDSILREYQWHLFEATMSGKGSLNWDTDSEEERLKALWLINHGTDVISVHAYNLGYAERYVSSDDTKGKIKFTTNTLFNKEGARLGRAIYNGETAGLLKANGRPGTFAIRDKEWSEAIKRFIDKEIIEQDGQLTHWWTFHSDRKTQDAAEGTCIRTTDRTSAGFDVIADANKRLQEKYVVNAISEESIGKAEISDAPVEKEAPGPWLWIVIAAAAAVCAAAVVLILAKGKKKTEQ